MSRGQKNKEVIRRILTMKCLLLFASILCSVANCFGQQNLDPCQKYFRGIYRNTRFEKSTDLVETIAGVLFRIQEGRSVTYIETKSAYVGVLNQFFLRSVASNQIPNQDKYLFVFNKHKNLVVLYLNSISDRKAYSDTLAVADLFSLGGNIKGYVFNEKYEFVMTFAIYRGDVGNNIEVSELRRTKSNQFVRRLDSRCKTSYEDYINASISDLVDYTNCIVLESKVAGDWELSTYNKNYLVRIWESGRRFVR
jgi:hypothetical protein